MQTISRRDFLRGTIASAVGLGIVGLPPKSWPSQEEFDYIVIGAGSAGCVVANRLAADFNTKVLLLEAGPLDMPPAIPKEVAEAIDALDLGSLFSLWGPEAALTWFFLTAPEPVLRRRNVPLIAGKVLGGGSTINGRIFFRGSPKNFDAWSDLGNEGWSYQEVLPYFKRFEDYQGEYPSALRGTGGPVPIIHLPSYTPAAEMFPFAAEELGFSRLDGPGWDFNGAQQEGGAGLTESNVYPDTLTRASMASAYIHPLLGQRNFTVKTGVLTTRVLFERTRAIGVEYWKGGRKYKARATREVIVSAGAYNTPKLLMLSGIGQAGHLRSHGIPVVANLPGVGRNLQDHVLVLLTYTSKIQQDPPPLIFTEASLFTHIVNKPEADSADLQFFFAGLLDEPDRRFDFGMTLVPVVARPRSVGSVSLRSKNPQDPPVILHNYLSRDQDMKVLLEGLLLGRELLHTDAFADMLGEEVRPGAHVTKQNELREYIRNTCNTDWHPSCSCRMGHDRLAVVDPQLRVHGVTGLRVVDASICPFIPSGNLMGTCIMIGEKGAAEIIKDPSV